MAKRTSEKMSVTTQNRRRKRCGRWGRGQFKSPPSKRRETYLQVRGPTVKQNESIRRGDVNLRSPAHTHQVIHVWVSGGPIPFPTFHSKPKAAPASALGSRGDPGFRWRDSQGAAFPGLPGGERATRAGPRGSGERILLPPARRVPSASAAPCLSSLRIASANTDPCREALCPVRESARCRSALGLGFAGPGGIRWVVSGNERPGRKSAAGDASWAGRNLLGSPQPRAAAPPPRSAGRRAIWRLYTSGTEERRGRPGGVGGAPGKGDQAAELRPGKCSCFPKYYQYRAQVGSARGRNSCPPLRPFFVDKARIPAPLPTLLGLGWPLYPR